MVLLQEKTIREPHVAFGDSCLLFVQFLFYKFVHSLIFHHITICFSCKKKGEKM